MLLEIRPYACRCCVYVTCLPNRLAAAEEEFHKMEQAQTKGNINEVEEKINEVGAEIKELKAKIHKAEEASNQAETKQRREEIDKNIQIWREEKNLLQQEKVRLQEKENLLLQEKNLLLQLQVNSTQGKPLHTCPWEHIVSPECTPAPLHFKNHPLSIRFTPLKQCIV